jgi:uncharacterized protein involved in outer membrane biogenesis
MKWLKRIGLLAGAVVLILAVVPIFISLEDYIPRIEQEVSARLKEPVKIGGLRAAGLPLPHIVVSGVSVGKTEDIKVGKVSVTPDLWSLLGETKVIKSIEIEQLVLTQKAIDKIPVWTGGDKKKPAAPAGPAPVRVESIRLDDAIVKLKQATIGPFDARVRLDAGGNPESASFLTRDGKLKAEVRPDGRNFLIDAVAKDWKVPGGTPLHFDELVIKGVATLTDANLGEIRARLYGGTVTGKATAAWQKGMQVKGSADVSQLEIRPILAALGKPATLSGRLTARPVVFSASAAKPDQLVNALRLETPFEVRNGILHGVDLKKAATSLISRDGGKGGETRFDKLSGRLAIDRGTRRITQIDVVSGSLSADGNVTISPKDELAGRINTKVQAASVTAASMPLNVSGTLDSPLLLPTGGTLAGAAVGTAVLGPGIGTTVGSKVGQWTEGLFGKKEEKK